MQNWSLIDRKRKSSSNMTTGKRNLDIRVFTDFIALRKKEKKYDY